MRVLRRGVVVAGFIASLGHSRSVYAAGPGSETEPAVPQAHWYGWQTLALDGGAALMAATTVATSNQTDGAFWALSIGTFALGAPIVHIVHGRPGVGLGDFALRLAVPFVGMYLGAQVDKNAPMTCDTDLDCRTSVSGLVAGGLIGAAGVSALDAAVFAFERTKTVAPSDEASARLQIWPSLMVTPHGGRAAMSGSF